MGQDADALGVRRGAGLSDGVTSAIVLGREVNAANEAWERWADAGGRERYPEVDVHNYAVDLGLVTEAV